MFTRYVGHAFTTIQILLNFLHYFDSAISGIWELFLDQNGFMIGSRTGMGIVSVPCSLWVYFQFQDCYGFKSGSRTAMGS